MIFRIQHLIRTREAGFPHNSRVHLADRDDSGQHVLFLLRIRLMKHPLVALSERPRLVGVDARNNKDPVFHLLLHPREPVHIVEHRGLIVRGTGSYDQQKLIAFSGQDVCDRAVALLLDGPYPILNRKLLLDLLGDRQFPDKFHIHFHVIIPL